MKPNRLTKYTLLTLLILLATVLWRENSVRQIDTQLEYENKDEMNRLIEKGTKGLLTQSEYERLLYLTEDERVKSEAYLQRYLDDENVLK